MQVSPLRRTLAFSASIAERGGGGGATKTLYMKKSATTTMPTMAKLSSSQWSGEGERSNQPYASHASTERPQFQITSMST